MFNFQYLISKELIYFPILIFLSTLCLGLFNSDWYSLLFYQLLFLLLYSAKIKKNRANWVYSFIVCLACFLFNTTLKIPKISMGANVFIGGENYKESVFKKNLHCISLEPCP